LGFYLRARALLNAVGHRFDGPIIQGERMFNSKPGPFPKPADSQTGRTLRPGGQSSLSGGMSATQPGNAPPVSLPGDTPAALAATPAARDAASAGSTEQGSRLIVGPDVKLKGAEILDCDTLVVEGRVEATMDSRVIRIAEHGAYSGTVGIDIAEIHGHFDGELTARQRLIVHATGRVSGKIRYGSILIEEGGEISGDVKSLTAAGKDASRPAKELPTGERRVLSALAG
jgi:cytoskeletal protein CcmA (bactofilin family)